ncbi:MAG TPA: ammonium transporter [Solirubrobacteraceae bacterium]|nr:ammonium transporter [Solirubrobacteraceae bacterium]
MRSRFLRTGALAVLATALASLLLPGAALAQEDLAEQVTAKAAELDMVWVAIACVLVFFMQAGFMFLEIGFSRQKNAGTGVAKILVNLALVTIAWWAVGFGINGGGNDFFGTDGFFFHFGQEIGSGAEATVVAAGDTMMMLFGLAFCAVSLAIVWGTTLERIKFGAYVVYALVFGALIYPLIAHAVWGGGLLSDVGGKPVMDFAGSSVVHLTGATGALAALLLLGARKGKYGGDGKPRVIPGHSMPLVGLGVIILWIGWFGFNGGSTFESAGSFFGEVMLNTQLGAAAGVIGASLVIYMKTKSLDVGMAGNGAIAGLVAITAPCGFVEYWAAPIIGFIGGVIVVYGVLAFDKKLDDPVGALSAHGLAGIWGTLAVGVFGSERLILDGAGPGVWYAVFGDATFSSALGQLGVQAAAVGLTFAVVFVLSYATFALIKATMGLRVPDEEEEAGLDISSHGMYGYPEQFIPQPEYSTGMPGGVGLGASPAIPAATASAMTASTESR